MLVERWNRLWFSETSLVRLGLFRIAMLLLASAHLGAYASLVFRDAASVSAGAAERKWTPIYLFDVLGLEPIGLETARVGGAVLATALLLALVGLFTRVACAVAAVLGLYWIGITYSFGKPHHESIAFTFTLLALPLAPVGARLSIDAVIARVRRAARGGDPTEMPETSDWAGIPMRLCQITVVFGYFFAGMSKLVIAGPGWANGYSLMGMLVRYDSPWSQAFTQNVALCRVYSVGTLLVQATFPLVFLVPAARWFYLPAAIGFHVSTWQMMDTGPYMSLWFCLIAFLPLERIPAWLSAGLRSPSWVRRVFVLAAVGVPTVFVTRILLYDLPRWSLLFAIPPVVAFVLAQLDGARFRVVYDPASRAGRVWTAVVSALDWSGRAEVVPDPRAPAPVAVAERGGLVTGLDAARVVARRLALTAPLAWVLGPRRGAGAAG